MHCGARPRQSLAGGRHTARRSATRSWRPWRHFRHRCASSLAWDQGKEMALHSQIALAMGMPVFFCDKASPWQRLTTKTPTGYYASTSPRAPT
jgi:transposase, IS30 family